MRMLKTERWKFKVYDEQGRIEFKGNAKEVAKYLGKSVNWIYNAFNRYRCDTAMIGGRLIKRYRNEVIYSLYDKTGQCVFTGYRKELQDYLMADTQALSAAMNKLKRNVNKTIYGYTLKTMRDK